MSVARVECRSLLIAIKTFATRRKIQQLPRAASVGMDTAPIKGGRGSALTPSKKKATILACPIMKVHGLHMAKEWISNVRLAGPNLDITVFTILAI